MPKVDLVPKSVSLAKWFNLDKEYAIDKNLKGALHAQIQATGSQAARERTVFNWVKAHKQGKFKGAEDKLVSAYSVDRDR